MMDDIIERIRESNPIEDVIEESGFLLHGHGRYRRGRGRDYDSLVVNVRDQMFVWNSRASDGWRGDVFTWVMKFKGFDFKGAVEYLAKRAGLPAPVWGAVNEGEVQRKRATANVFSVAAEVLHRWLGGDEDKGTVPDQDALDYARATRGWTDETLDEALIGFSGRKQAWQIKDMQGEFSLHGIDPESPQAVAILGFSGDVAAWGKRWDVDAAAVADWAERGRIHGLMDTPGLIYVHRHNGQVQYLTRRQLPGFDVIRQGGKERPWKSFNPPVALVGSRQPYFNHVYRRDAGECVIVEGQGDAVTLGQWGFAAVALCGVQARDPAMGWLAGHLKKHQTLYLALDADEAGQGNLEQVAQAFGPMIRVVQWEWTADDEEDEADNG